MCFCFFSWLKEYDHISNLSYGKCSKVLNTFLFLFSNRFWLSQLKLTKCSSEKQTVKTKIRLLLQKQSDLGLPCLSRLLYQATTVQNFRTFTVPEKGQYNHSRTRSDLCWKSNLIKVYTVHKPFWKVHVQSKLFITSLVITEYSISDINLLGTDRLPLKFPIYNRIFT